MKGAPVNSSLVGRLHSANEGEAGAPMFFDIGRCGRGVSLRPVKKECSAPGVGNMSSGDKLPSIVSGRRIALECRWKCWWGLRKAQWG